MTTYAQFWADLGITPFWMAIIILALVVAHRIVASARG
jgi:hypothetical protein